MPASSPSSSATHTDAPAAILLYLVLDEAFRLHCLLHGGSRAGLDILNERGNVRPTMADKHAQINRYLEIAARGQL